ncbi:hypothetical protein MTO96_036704 [Rhipicephalus appendiculatus]
MFSLLVGQAEGIACEDVDGATCKGIEYLTESILCKCCPDCTERIQYDERRRMEYHRPIFLRGAFNAACRTRLKASPALKSTQLRAKGFWSRMIDCASAALSA